MANWPLRCSIDSSIRFERLRCWVRCLRHRMILCDQITFRYRCCHPHFLGHVNLIELLPKVTSNSLHLRHCSSALPPCPHAPLDWILLHRNRLSYFPVIHLVTWNLRCLHFLGCFDLRWSRRLLKMMNQCCWIGFRYWHRIDELILRLFFKLIYFVCFFYYFETLFVRSTDHHLNFWHQTFWNLLSLIFQF